jgi:hypothetical protein
VRSRPAAASAKPEISSAGEVNCTVSNRRESPLLVVGTKAVCREMKPHDFMFPVSRLQTPDSKYPVTPLKRILAAIITAFALAVLSGCGKAPEGLYVSETNADQQLELLKDGTFFLNSGKSVRPGNSFSTVESAIVRSAIVSGSYTISRGRIQLRASTANLLSFESQATIQGDVITDAAGVRWTRGPANATTQTASPKEDSYIGKGIAEIREKLGEPDEKLHGLRANEEVWIYYNRARRPGSSDYKGIRIAFVSGMCDSIESYY